MPMSTAYASQFLDAELNHSSGYFDDPEMSLEDAQRAKVKAILDHCRVEPSMRLLDVGCGWGAAARSASRTYGARVIGIAIEDAQLAYAIDAEKGQPVETAVDYRLQRWEDFDEPVDRIICINAFENFDDKKAFLSHCRSLLPVGGVMVMLTVTADRPMFRVISKREIIATAEGAGFEVHVSESLAAHYVRTLERYCDNLSTRMAEVARLIGAERVKKSMDYYTSCAGFLESGMNDMFEFTFTAR